MPMACEILKLCDLWTYHKDGGTTITVGAQFWDGKLHVALCRQTEQRHFPHLDLVGSDPLVVTEKILRILRQVA